jgi:hypothetical protein
MSGFASGKFAIALCDQCGQRYKLLELIRDWKGFKVCEECYEPKHPQLEPKRTITEPQALYQPRPESKLLVTIFVGFTADTSFSSVGMTPMPYAKPLDVAGLMGQVGTRIT